MCVFGDVGHYRDVTPTGKGEARDGEEFGLALGGGGRRLANERYGDKTVQLVREREVE